LEKRGQLYESLAKRRDFVAMEERLAAIHPRDLTVARDLAVARGYLAGLLRVLGERGAARDLYRSGLGVVEQLAGQDPDDAELQRWRGAFLSSLARLDLDEERPRDALKVLSRACAIFEALVARDPTNPDWQLQKGVCHARRAEALEEIDPEDAARQARAGLQLLQPLLGPEADDNVRSYAAEAELTLGRLAAAAGRMAESRAACERSLKLVSPAERQLPSWRLLDPQARALACLGRTEEAKQAEARLRQMGYRRDRAQGGG
jgi:tetratricopeptide (TPR) repeat protein